MLLQKQSDHRQLPTTGPNTNIAGSSYRGIPNSQFPGNQSLHVVGCIVQENNFLKHQIHHLQAQIHKASSLSNRLLKQNQGMRKLYTQRTQDIKKLIGTFSINNDETKIDYQHQCFLVQQLNCATLKQIKKLDKQRYQKQQKIDQRKLVLDQLSQTKNILENESLTRLRVRLNNGISQETAKKMKRQYDKQAQNVQQLENQVNGLIVIIGELNKNLRELKSSEEPMRNIIMSSKEECQRRLKKVTQENIAYKQQIQNLKIDLSRFEEDKTFREQRNSKMSQNLMDQMRKYQKFKHLEASLIEEEKIVCQKLTISNKNKNILKNKLQNVNQQKIALLQQIADRKERIAGLNKEFNFKEDNLRKQNKENVEKLSNQITKSIVINHEQQTKIKKQQEKYEALIDSLSAQHNILEQQVNEYEALTKKYPSPCMQIQKIQLMLRLKKSK